MIILGVILLVVGFLLGFQILWVIGACLAVVGVILLLTGTVGHRPIGGRSHYW
jgi:VIT1/CCC1 family predicted Fe2+/Mn2+ transporter